MRTILSGLQPAAEREKAGIKQTGIKSYRLRGQESAQEHVAGKLLGLNGWQIGTGARGGGIIWK